MKVNIGNYPKVGERKVFVDIQPSDTWNLDGTLAAIIYPALLQLKATKQGVPGNFTTVGGENYTEQDSFDFYKESCDEAFKKACEKWEEVLDKMIWSFEQLLKNDYDDLYHHGKINWNWVKTDKTYPNPVTGKMEPTYQMVDENPDEHWYDFEGHQLHDERIQEGLELFGKYYRALWD